jgi:F420-dependent methylenetetrahydromethanopterin dehydrogenase
MLFITVMDDVITKIAEGQDSALPKIMAYENDRVI